MRFQNENALVWLRPKSGVLIPNIVKNTHSSSLTFALQSWPSDTHNEIIASRPKFDISRCFFSKKIPNNTVEAEILYIAGKAINNNPYCKRRFRGNQATQEPISTREIPFHIILACTVLFSRGTFGCLYKRWLPTYTALFSSGTFCCFY